MRMFLQIAVFLALALFCALQIPRRALFFQPRKGALPGPGAAFVALDAAAYRQALARFRLMAGEKAAVGWKGHAGDPDLGVSALAEEIEAPVAFDFAIDREAPGGTPGAILPQEGETRLWPPTLAAGEVTARAPVAAAAPPAKRPIRDFCDLQDYETLRERD